MSNVLTLDSEHLLAREVLAAEMGNACDGETTLALARRWEGEQGKALVYPWEELEEGGFKDTYFARKKVIEKKAKPKAEVTLHIAPEQALFELGRLQRGPWKDQQKYAARINELEIAIGFDPTDYSQKAPPVTREETIEVDEWWQEFQKDDVAARVAGVSAETNREKLMRAFYEDQSDKVKNSVVHRLTQLMAAE